MRAEPGDVDEPPLSETRPYLAVRGGLNDTAGTPDATGTPDTDSASRLPPYLLTSGRAEPVDHTLEIEAQVLATELGTAERASLWFEHRDIVELCTRTMSVVEVAASLRLHIGVARVLVADLAALGYLDVQRPGGQPSEDRNLIERVIRGLEAIR